MWHCYSRSALSPRGSAPLALIGRSPRLFHDKSAVEVCGIIISRSALSPRGSAPLALIGRSPRLFCDSNVFKVVDITDLPFERSRVVRGPLLSDLSGNLFRVY